MEGGANPKKMARSKRASSQRSRAKHSRHGAASAVAREKAVSSGDSLSHNWERYESSSDEDAAPLAEGEVRPKSKGADYSELLLSDVPKLFEEPPEPEGMMAMLLANGLGLWDWDSSYLEPASSTSEWQAAREASALLTVDLRLLGKSIGRLNIAQRLFVEEGLFPKQDHVDEREQSIDPSKRISDYGSGDAAVEDRFVQEHDAASWGSRVSSGNVPANLKFPPLAASSGTTSFDDPGLDYRGDIEAERVGVTVESSFSTKLPSASRDDTATISSRTVDTVTISSRILDTVTVSSRTVDSMREPTVEMKEKEKEILREPFGLKKFEATAAEAELDDLLSMLDNQAAGMSLNKGNQYDLLKNSQSSNFLSPLNSTPSRPFNPGFQDSWAESRPREVTLESELETAPKNAGLSTATGKKVDTISSSDVLPSQDDDFDSWLDSI